MQFLFPLKPLRILQRPEYFFRPKQIWRRLRRNTILVRDQVQLAWGLPVQIDPTSIVGQDVLNVGLFDRVVPEAICRLLEPAEHALDIGANFGVMSSIMALVAGPRGYVGAFEPNQKAAVMLNENVRRWAPYNLSPIEVVGKGLSSKAGLGILYQADDLGGYSLKEVSPGRKGLGPDGRGGAEIELTTLDSVLPRDIRIGLMKLDVEGHEASVLQGAAILIGEGRVRDVIYEDYEAQPSPVTNILQKSNYTIFALVSSWQCPNLVSLRAHKPRAGFTHNYLATRNPDRALARFRKSGWQCLRIRAKVVSFGAGAFGA